MPASRPSHLANHQPRAGGARPGRRGRSINPGGWVDTLGRLHYHPRSELPYHPAEGGGVVVENLGSELEGKEMSNTTLIVVIVLLLLVFGGGGGYYWRNRRR